jgi:hypothetical protein
MKPAHLHVLRSLAACALGLAMLPAQSKAQTIDGTLNLEYQSMDQTYTTDLYVNGSQWGSPEVYAEGQTLAATNLTAGSEVISGPLSLYAFCIELGMDTPQNVNPVYNVFDPNSAALGDTTSLASTQNPTSGPAAIDAAAGITATGGIGAYRANQLELLYGYAFGTSGALSSGYNPSSLSSVDQAAFQIDVWKLSHEGTAAVPATLFTGGVTATGFSVAGGNLNSAVINEANSLLTGVLNDQGITPMALEVLNNGTYQDFLLPEGGQNPFIAVPEPTTYAAVIGLFTLGFVAVRRRFAPVL